MFKQTGAALAAVLLCGSMAPMADEVTDQIGVAVKAYEAGNLGQAVDELQYAIAQIQERQQGELATLLPEPLAGWTAAPASVQSGGLAAMATGTQVSRDYTKDSGESVTLTIMANSPLTQSVTMMLANPMVLQMSPDIKMYRLKGQKGVLQHRPGSREWELSLILRDGTVVRASGQGLADKGPAEAYLKAVDLKAVSDALAK